MVKYFRSTHRKIQKHLFKSNKQIKSHHRYLPNFYLKNDLLMDKIKKLYYSNIIRISIQILVIKIWANLKKMNKVKNFRKVK